MAKQLEAKRERIFDLFSHNLNLLSKAPGVQNKKDLKGIFICPLCLRHFSKDALKPESPNQLTFEDVPPKSLGGKIRTLTCKECNNHSGRDIDVHIVNVLKNIDFSTFSPNSSSKVKFKIGEGEVNGQVEINKEGVVVLNIDTKSSHPKHANNLSYHVEKNKSNIQGVPLKFSKQEYKADKRKAEVALLRIAYLTSFSVFGYGFIFNSNQEAIRHQILNPETEIIPRLTPIQIEFPKEFYGINLINSPDELRCFLIIFDLKTPSRNYQFAIPLPAPFKSGITIYDNLKERLAKGETNVNIEAVPNHDYLRDEEFVTYPIGIWKKEILKEDND